MPAFGPAFSPGAARRRFSESKLEHTQSLIASDDVAYGVFASYALSAMADPKAPMEVKVMGAAPWSWQVLMMATFLYWADPLDLREDAGLDESYSLFQPVRSRVDRIVESATDLWNTPAPNLWDFW